MHINADSETSTCSTKTFGVGMFEQSQSLEVEELEAHVQLFFTYIWSRDFHAQILNSTKR